MAEFIIKGSHFTGIMQAMDHMIHSKRTAEHVLLVCDDIRSQFILKLEDGRELARFEY